MNLDLKGLIEQEELVNESERFVLEELENQLSDLPASSLNDDALLDMITYALNKVPSRYRVNLLGRLFSSVADDEYTDKIKAAVAEAVQVVLENPPRSS
ncbi:late competence development ComFB family protein [Spirochaeta dissipatitropha]